jgi:hypothetical protein
MRVAPAFILISALGFLAGIPPARAAAPFPVDVELVFAIDISGSINHEEAALQRDAVVAAVRSDAFIASIRAGRLGSIAVTALGYANDREPASRTLVEWRLVRERTLGNAFADELLAAQIASGRRTSMSSGIEMATRSLESNNFEGARKVVLFFGDGKNNFGNPLAPARDAAAARGITIVGLPLMVDLPERNTFPDLPQYFATCVAAGEGAFIHVINRPEDVQAALDLALGPRADNPNGPFQNQIGTGRSCDVWNPGVARPTP